MIANIEQNIRAIKAKIADACQRAGRDPASVKLVAVSKTVGLPEVEAAVAAGQLDYGENRTTLLTEKQAAFPQLNWHFIGSIQTNKVKHFVGSTVLVHSVASERALLAIDKRAQALDIVQNILFEVNTSGEVAKDGVDERGLAGLLELASGLGHVRVEGLMTMAAQGDEAAARKSFANLRELRDKYQKNYASLPNILLRELSMGMSEDFCSAIEEGATIVRIGRSIWV